MRKGIVKTIKWILGARNHKMIFEDGYHDGAIIIKCEKCGVTDIAYDEDIGTSCEVCKRQRVQFFFKWFDFWIGFYWNKTKKHLYILPLPMIGIKIRINKIYE